MDLKKITEHLNYEYTQLEFLAVKLPGMCDDDVRLQWACLEAFLVHARVLLDFLHLWDGNGLASNYVVKTEWWQDKVVEQALNTDLLKDARNYANQRVAHLTPERYSTIPEVKYLDIARDIEKAFHEFLKLAKPELLCDQLRELKNTPEQRPIEKVYAVVGHVTISTSPDTRAK